MNLCESFYEIIAQCDSTFYFHIEFDNFATDQYSKLWTLLIDNNYSDKRVLQFKRFTNRFKQFGFDIEQYDDYEQQLMFIILVHYYFGYLPDAI